MTPDKVEEILEEFRRKQDLVEPEGFLADVGEDFEAVDFNMEAMGDWLRTTLTQHHQDLRQEERERAVQIITDELKNAPLEVQMTKGVIFANIIKTLTK